MKLIKLYLNNYGPFYGDNEFQLSDKHGIISVIGDNGRGKSTLLGSIPFILYGEGKFDTLIDLLNTKALAEGKEASCEAGLEFSVGNDIFLVERIINSRGKMTSKLSVNGQLLTRKSEEVDSKILEILRYTYRDLDYTLYSSQKNAAKFFNIKKNSDKKDFLYEMFNVNSENILEFIKNKQSKMEKVTKIVDSKYSTISSIVKSKIDELDRLNVFISTNKYDESKEKDLLKNIESFKHKKLDYEKILSDNSESTKKHSKIKSDLSDLENKLQDTQQSSKKILDSLSKLKGRLSDISTREIVSKKISKIKFDAGRYNTAVKFISDIDAKIFNYRQLIKNIESKIFSESQDLKEHEAKIDEYQKSIDNDECPVCKTKGVKSGHIASEMSNLLEIKQRKLKSLDSLNSELSSTTTLLEKDSSTLERAKLKFSDLEKLKTEFDNSLLLRKEKLKSLKEIRSIRIDIARDTKSFEVTQSSLETIQGSISSLKIELDSIKVINADQYRGEISKLDELILESTSELDKMMNSKNQIEFSKLKVKDLDNEVKKLESRKARYSKVITNLTTRLSWVKEFKVICQNTFNDYTTVSIASVVNLTNKFLSDINSGLELNISVEKDFICNIYRDGTPVPFSLISGGLEVLLGICFRLGVWRFISNKKKSPVSFLILDEVFGELSPSNAQVLYNHIAGLKKYFTYIFITSHTDHVWQSDYTLSVGT